MNKNKPFVLTLFSLAIYNTLAETEIDMAPSIKVKQGIITGLKEISENGKIFYSYYGIPYAEPPVNKLRFKDPKPKSPWKGYHDGTKTPENCPFLSDPFHLPPSDRVYEVLGKEDCLTLNVFTPQSNSTNTRLPVMVYIHGGGFHTGSSSQQKPYFLMDKQIVLVIIQYRLGILGFLSTEDEILPGNMGLKDQLLALKWVKENIECFGGDPNLVTIFGQSAGGSSVHYHLLSPASKGLFQRAIMQSGTALCPFAYPADALKSAKAAADHFNCSLEKGTKRYIECMQSIDFRDLITFASEQLKTWMFPRKFTPRVDGNILPDRPEVLLKNGNYTKVDTMLGHTRDEGAYIVIYMIAKPTVLEKLNTNFCEYGPKSLVLEDEKDPVHLATQIYNHYLNKTTNITTEDFENIQKLFTDSRIKLCSYITGKFMAKDPDVNLYMYQMDHFGSVTTLGNLPGYDRNRYKWIGHSDDLLYFFGDKGSITEESDIKVQNMFLSAWTNFAKYGNPNLSSLPCNCSWEEATKKNFRYLSIKEFPEMKDYEFPEANNFWSRLKTMQNEVLVKN